VGKKVGNGTGCTEEDKCGMNRRCEEGMTVKPHVKRWLGRVSELKLEMS
jgi:hypothetical protein